MDSGHWTVIGDLVLITRHHVGKEFEPTLIVQSGITKNIFALISLSLESLIFASQSEQGSLSIVAHEQDD
jgi:hypothetical protein